MGPPRSRHKGVSSSVKGLERTLLLEPQGRAELGGQGAGDGQQWFPADDPGLEQWRVSRN